MAVAFTSDRRELNPALGSIGELKNVIQHRVLEAHRFTDVVHTESEVAGNRDGCRLFVLHLPIVDRSFWRVVVCGCDGNGPAGATVDEVWRAIDELHFL
jgi:hypothetical protein